jgi:hypothetical protein
VALLMEPIHSTLSRRSWAMPPSLTLGRFLKLFPNFSCVNCQFRRFIVLQHDLFEISVDLAVGYTLDAALNHQPKFNVRISHHSCYGFSLTRNLSSWKPLVNAKNSPREISIWRPIRMKLSLSATRPPAALTSVVMAP